jgi:hypothetical protein
MKQFPLIYYIAVGIELEMLSKRQECKVYLAEVLWRMADSAGPAPLP